MSPRMSLILSTSPKKVLPRFVSVETETVGHLFLPQCFTCRQVIIHEGMDHKSLVGYSEPHVAICQHP